MCDKFIRGPFKIQNWIFSKFYALKMKEQHFSDGSLLCRLYGYRYNECLLTTAIYTEAEFDKATANKADFRTSNNYSIDPSKTKIKKAQFSLEGVKAYLDTI
jgi:uncharacterized protein YjbI with pentapeptide repeats